MNGRFRRHQSKPPTPATSYDEYKPGSQTQPGTLTRQPVETREIQTSTYREPEGLSNAQDIIAIIRQQGIDLSQLNAFALASAIREETARNAPPVAPPWQSATPDTAGSSADAFTRVQKPEVAITGNNYGTTIVRRGASTFQGNISDGSGRINPMLAKQHNYECTIVEDLTTKHAQGNTTAAALLEQKFWRGMPGPGLHQGSKG